MVVLILYNYVYNKVEVLGFLQHLYNKKNILGLGFGGVLLLPLNRRTSLLNPI